MDDTDIKYGSLFKKSGFFRDQNTGRSSWGKRFFAFNKWTMMLQYWGAEEERIFKLDGSVRTIPKNGISLLSSQLIIKSGPTERSMFGQKYPIIITNGPAFGNRVLVLSSTSSDIRDGWIESITSGLNQLKERQRVALMQMEIIADPNHPSFNTLDNQYRIKVDVESKIKELDLKINRASFQCQQMCNKDNMLYNKQERLSTTHRHVEDKLYALTCEDTHPQRRFKFIAPNAVKIIKEMPVGIYKHTAPTFLSKPHHRPSSLHNQPLEALADRDNRSKVVTVMNPDIVNCNDQYKLEDAHYYPDHTENIIVANIHKPLHGTKTRNLDHQIRQLDDSDDVDLQSFAELNVFELLKKENTKNLYHLIKDNRDDIGDSESSGSCFSFDPWDEEYEIEELDYQMRNPEAVCRRERREINEKNLKKVEHDIDTYHISEQNYLVDGKTDRF